jgi:hypothetical protein
MSVCCKDISRFKEDCSFLKKRTKRLLILRQRKLAGHGRERGTSAQSKSFLVLFFKKEHLPSRLIFAGDLSTILGQQPKGGDPVSHCVMPTAVATWMITAGVFPAG